MYDAQNVVVALFIHVETVQRHNVSEFWHKTKTDPVITTTMTLLVSTPFIFTVEHEIKLVIDLLEVVGRYNGFSILPLNETPVNINCNLRPCNSYPP